VTLDTALTIASLRAVDLWRISHGVESPDDLREQALDLLTTEVIRMVNVAGEALGTDPAMRGPGCVDALAAHVETLRERWEREREATFRYGYRIGLSRGSNDETEDEVVALWNRTRAILGEPYAELAAAQAEAVKASERWWADKWEDWRHRAEAAEAEVERLRGMRCETCRHWDECGGDGQGMCEFFGVHTRTDFACNAWEPRT